MSHAISPFSSKIDWPSHFFQKGLDLEKCAQRQLPSNLYNLSLIKGEIFPFQSTMEYVPEWDHARMQNQFAAIYNRCVKNRIPTSCAMFSNALMDYNIDLTNKDIIIDERKLLKVECRLYYDKIMKIVFYFIAYAPPHRLLEKESHFLNPDKAVQLFQFGGAVLNGNEQEVYQLGTKNPSVPCWGNWRSEDPAASEFYQTEIYPICMNIVESMSRAYGPGCKVLDVGGGDGTLALALAQLPNISKVDVIDSSVKQTQLLKKRIGCDCPWLSPKAKSVTNVHKGDLTQKTGWASIQDTQYQVIIMSGVLADQVIAERDQINFILNKCKNHLAPQGVIVIASYSNSRVNSALLKEHTLNVLNQSRFPSKSPFIIDPFYVASQE